MPPQNSQPTPTISSPVQTQDPGLLTKKIGNAGQSTLLLGIFMTLLGTVSMLGVSSLPADRQKFSLIFLIIVIITSIFWVVQGLSIKKSTEATAALSKITTVMLSAFVLFALTIIGMTLKPGGGGLAGLFALVLGLYLLVAKSGIKKLSLQ